MYINKYIILKFFSIWSFNTWISCINTCVIHRDLDSLYIVDSILDSCENRVSKIENLSSRIENLSARIENLLSRIESRIESRESENKDSPMTDFSIILLWASKTNRMRQHQCCTSGRMLQSDEVKSVSSSISSTTLSNACSKCRKWPELFDGKQVTIRR